MNVAAVVRRAWLIGAIDSPQRLGQGFSREHWWSAWRGIVADHHARIRWDSILSVAAADEE